MPGELELWLQALIAPNPTSLPLISALLLLGNENLRTLDDSTSTATLTPSTGQMLTMGLASRP